MSATIVHGLLTSKPARRVRIALLFALTLLLIAYAGVRDSSAEPQTPPQTPTQTDGSVAATAATADSGADPGQPASTGKSKAKAHKAKAGPDGGDAAADGRVKEPKARKDGDESSSGESVKPPKHPSWTPAPGIKLDFKARIETETRPMSPPASLDQSVLQWQDRRLGVEGSVSKRVTFEISRELGRDFDTAADAGEKTAWKDAYVSARVTKGLSIDAGRFKLPFGREELTGETNLDFANRSLAARVLSPGRDVGLMAHGRLFGRRADYQIGYFTRDGENGRTSQTQGGRDALAARLVLTPFRRVANPLVAPLEIGVAVENSHLDNRLGIRGRTVLGDGIFFDRVYVNGLRRRVGVDAGWEHGPVALSTEFIATSEERKGMGFGGDDLPGIVAHAWSLAGTWALTGERKHGRLEPSHDLLRGGFGAFELAVRTEALGFDTTAAPSVPFGLPTVSGNADHSTTVGVNWYVNHYVKLQSDVVMEWIDEPERSPSPATGGRFISTVFLLQFHF